MRRLLGIEGGFGKLLGLDDEWAYRADQGRRNYGELYDALLRPKALGLPRGLNKHLERGRLQYALPFR